MRIAPEPRSRPAVGCRKAKELCLSQPFRQHGEPRAYGDWLAAVPVGICARFRAEESELTSALHENGSGTQHECWI